jgi:hypothetical protein
MRKAWIQWADGRDDSPISEGANGVIELPLIGPEIAGIRLEPAPAPPPPTFAPSRTRQVESFPMGRHVEPGFPPAPRVMLTVPDNRPEGQNGFDPEPPKPKPKRGKGRAA